MVDFSRAPASSQHSLRAWVPPLGLTVRLPVRLISAHVRLEQLGHPLHRLGPISMELP